MCKYHLIGIICRITIFTDVQLLWFVSLQCMVSNKHEHGNVGLKTMYRYFHPLKFQYKLLNLPLLNLIKELCHEFHEKFCVWICTAIINYALKSEVAIMLQYQHYKWTTGSLQRTQSLWKLSGENMTKPEGSRVLLLQINIFNCQWNELEHKIG